MPSNRKRSQRPHLTRVCRGTRPAAGGFTRRPCRRTRTFLCYLDWFGSVVRLQVIATGARLPPLGTGLLDKRVLHVDYVKQQLTLD